MAKSKTDRIGFILCVLVAAYFLFAVAYALVNAHNYATDLPRQLRYVVGPGLIGVGMLLAGLFLRPEKRLLAGIYAASVLFALFLFEAVLTVKSVRGSVGLAGYIKGASNDYERFRNAIPPSYTIQALNRKLAVPELSGALLSGIPNEEVLLCTRDNEPVSYVSDRFGFRNPDAVYGQDIELLLLGDSFTEGICLPDGSDIASQIRAAYPATVNTGTRGAGPVFELAVLRRWGPAFRPKNVVMLFFEGNDWQNLNSELKKPSLQGVLDLSTPTGPTMPDPALVKQARGVVSDWWEEDAQTLSGFLGRRAWMRNFFALQQTALVLGLHYPRATTDRPEYLEILKTAKTVTEGWGGSLSLVYVPQVDRFVGLLPSSAAYEDLRQRVETASKTAGVQFIDLTPTIYGSDVPRALYAPDSHLSEEGARIGAQKIIEALSQTAVSE